MSAQDTVLRFALGMFAIAPDSPCTPEQRVWILARLERLDSLTRVERAKIRQPLMDWYTKHHPRTLPIVAAQFEEQEV